MRQIECFCVESFALEAPWQVLGPVLNYIQNMWRKKIFFLPKNGLKIFPETSCAKFSAKQSPYLLNFDYSLMLWYHFWTYYTVDRCRFWRNTLFSETPCSLLIECKNTSQVMYWLWSSHNCQQWTWIKWKVKKYILFFWALFSSVLTLWKSGAKYYYCLYLVGLEQMIYFNKDDPRRYQIL